MPAQIHFYDTGTATWKQADTAWVYTGGIWQTVNAAWVWDGAWRKVYSTATFNALDVFNVDPFCDATAGSYRVAWSYNTAASGSTVNIEYDVGYGWLTGPSAIPIADNSYDGSLSGVFGFSSLDSTSFRVSIFDPDDANNQIIGSPKTLSGPFYCF